MKLIIWLGFITVVFVASYAIIKGLVMMTGVNPEAMAALIGLIALLAWASRG